RAAGRGGVRANRVITAAVLLSGVLAATVAVLLTAGVTGAGGPYVTPDYALGDTILVLVGVVVGGLDRLWTATLGGFAIGFANAALGGFLPSTGSWALTRRGLLRCSPFTP